MHEIIIDYEEYVLRVEYDYSHEDSDRDTQPCSEVKITKFVEHEPDGENDIDLKTVDESELRDLIHDKINDGELASDF